MKIDSPTTKKISDFFNINNDVVSLEELKFGLNVELEHSDITKSSPYLTAKITIKHLTEFPDYYKRLKQMEKEADEFWKGKKKPSIFK
jgi:hypothetical protein